MAGDEGERRSSFITYHKSHITHHLSEGATAMKVYGTQEIRNLGIVGHGDAGKTSLVAAMIFATGAASRLGRVDDGTAPTDYDEEEIARKISLNLTPAYAEYQGT